MLPHAIIAANRDQRAAGCPAGNRVDTVRLTYNTNLSDRVYCQVFDCADKCRAFPKRLEITSDITIEGDGNSVTARNSSTHGSALGHRRLFHVKSSGKLKVRYSFLTDGAYTGSWASNNEIGGAILNEGELSIEHSYVAANYAHDGGAIFSTGPLSIHGSTFVQNVGNKTGGAIFAAGGSVSISNSSFSWNTSSYDGGVIYSTVPEMISNSGFLNNKIDGYYKSGGAIHVRGSYSNIGSSDFVGNFTQHGHGGAISLVNADGNSTVSNSYFRDNRTAIGSIVERSGLGGAIAVDNENQRATTLTITGSRFDNNRAKHGGAIGSRSAGLLIRTSSFKGNHVTRKGGAIFRSYEWQSPIGLQIGNSTFYENSADFSGSAIAGGYYPERNSFRSRAVSSWIKNTPTPVPDTWPRNVRVEVVPLEGARISWEAPASGTSRQHAVYQWESNGDNQERYSTEYTGI